MEKIIHETFVRAAKVIQVIHVESLVGTGTEDDIFRRLDEYYDLEGYLLARVDSLPREREKESPDER